jgi:hypothetical protein
MTCTPPRKFETAAQMGPIITFLTGVWLSAFVADMRSAKRVDQIKGCLQQAGTGAVLL